MRRTLAVAAVVAALAMSVPSRARAQTCEPAARVPHGSCTVNTSTSITIPKVLQLTLSTKSQTLAAPAEEDFDAGHKDAAGPIATVRANAAWNLKINAATATWTASGAGARANKPSADLQWSTVSGSGYAGLTTTATAVMAGTATAETNVSFFYRVLYNWTADTPGTYALVVVFTLTAP
jgi:hypothetical protein